MTRRRGIGSTSIEKLKAEARTATVREIAEVLHKHRTEHIRKLYWAGESIEDLESVLWALIGKEGGNVVDNPGCEFCGKPISEPVDGSTEVVHKWCAVRCIREKEGGSR